MTISILDQRACILREIAMRESVYPKWVAAKKMKQETANIELDRMRAVLASIDRMQALDHVLALADELCTAVDNSAEDIGGSRSIKSILLDLGPAVDSALEQKS